MRFTAAALVDEPVKAKRQVLLLRQVLLRQREPYD
jgi:hypothetical protein